MDGLRSFQDQEIKKIFCRWVLMFNDRLDDIVQSIYDTLITGGRFISIEYFNFNQIDIFPKSAIFTKIYENVEALLKRNGGNPSVGSELFKIMEGKGFKNIEIWPFYRTGHPSSPLWKWLQRTNENHGNLVEAGLISQTDLDLYMNDWNQKSKSQHSFITAPPLMITVGEK